VKSERQVAPAESRRLSNLSRSLWRARALAYARLLLRHGIDVPAVRPSRSERDPRDIGGRLEMGQSVRAVDAVDWLGVVVD
jgi:hypothetical protein